LSGVVARAAAEFGDGVTSLAVGCPVEAVREPVVINPDPRLDRIAKKRGWRIEAW